MSTQGRPRVLDDGKRRDVCTLVSAGCGIQDAARYVGCSVKTIHREALRNDEFNQQLRGAEIKAQLESLRSMRKAADSNWRAAAWMLERTNPRRFARAQPKHYRADEFRDAINDIVDVALEEITDPAARDRVCRQLLVAAHYATRSLDDAQDRRRQGKAPSYRVSRDERSIEKLLTELDKSHEKALAEVFGKGQNPPGSA